MANPIENNSYRMLGLDVTASQKDILRRYKEIINRLKIDDEPKYDLDINLGSNYRTEEKVNNALKNLQSQKNNIKEYFFWFQISNSNDKKVIKYIVEEQFTEAIKALKEMAKVESVQALFYKKNLAILYCLLLEKTDNEKYLKDSLSLWDEIVKSEKFWTTFSRNYSEQNEQTVSEDNINSFRSNVAKEIADIYTDLGDGRKGTNYAKEFQEIFGVYNGASTGEECITTYLSSDK